MGTLAGAKALGLDAAIGSLDAGKEADLIAVDPSFAAALPGSPADDDPRDLMSRLIFRAHPDMVRAAWVRGRRLDGPRPPRNGGRHVTEHADLLISGGILVDGTGAPGRPGSIAVVEGRIRLLDVTEPPPENVAHRIDARGKVVAPGFIDLHSHCGLMILADGRHEPKVRQE